MNKRRRFKAKSRRRGRTIEPGVRLRFDAFSSLRFHPYVFTSVIPMPAGFETIHGRGIFVSQQAFDDAYRRSIIEHVGE